MIDLLVDPFTYVFMQRALAIAVVAALVCAVLSCWLVHLGWSLMGDAISHAVLPGVVLAYIVGWPFAVGAVVFALLAVVLIGAVRTTSIVTEDTAMGVVFTGLFASGLVLISVYPSEVDVTHVLFGNILGVTASDLIQVVVIALIVLAVLLVWRADFTLFAFDPVYAAAIGLRVGILRWVLLGALALTTVAALQAVGVILVVALLITPGATALLWTRNFRTMLVLAPIVSVSSALVGLYASYYADVSSGAAIVVVLCIHFVVAWIAGPRQGLRQWAATRRSRRLLAG